MHSPRLRFVISSTALAVGCSAVLAAGEQTRPPSNVSTALAVRATSPLTIDGALSEPVWEEAAPIDAFVQREPAEGQPPSQRTEARVAFDDHALYVGVRAFDAEPERIVGLLTRRDQRSVSDWIRVVVDSFFDRRSAYEFAVNPARVKADRYYFNDGASDDSWDAVWEVEVARDQEGWTAEFRIPFSQLRFRGSSGGTVGLAIIREIGRLAEVSSWPLLSRNITGFVSQFGELHGLGATSAAKRLELMPYMVGSLALAPGDGTALVDPEDARGSGGLDLKYALRPGLTLTATVNPDFGQVEADPAIVNLDAFEVFFQERRPFFVEGSGTFQFNVDCNDGSCTGLFYSRRIGRAPQRAPELKEGENAQVPPAATILGAAKLTGRVGNFSVGALTALTGEEDALIGGTGLSRRTQMVEPLTGFNVVRARREFADQSSVGFIATSTNRRVEDAAHLLAGEGYTGGVDYDARLGTRFSISGFWAGSRIEGSPEAITRLQESSVHAFQRPDADHLEVDPARTVLAGHAGAVSFGKIGGEKTRFNAHYGFKSPGFDINDLGFQRRADERYVSHWFQMRDNVPGRFTRSFVWNLNQYAGWNFGGDRLWSGGNVNMHWVWRNYSTTGFGINVNAAPVRDRVTRGGLAVLGNPTIGTWYYAGTDSRRTLALFYNGFHETDGQGTTRHNLSGSLTWRPSSASSVSLGLRYNINNDDSQWVANETGAEGATRPVFGRLRQRTAAVTIRANYTLTPDLSVQSYAEPFVSAGDYADYKVLVNPRAPEYRDRYQPYAYGRNADFNVRSFRTTNVLRWEYRPGSVLFAVWQQNRSGFEDVGTFRFGRDFRGVFSSPAHNVFLVKMSYWLNL
ncbi:MAG TPA: DUF5916 domain-containing protein [Vicinamibacterales bacterium]|nr:DUF5916 domain-containing protein [Vicinamibacterales bacterium]